MPGLDALAPDQKAVLQLLLKQGKSYGEIAGMLKMDPAGVRERALDALDALGAGGPPAAGALAAERQDEVADHLLGQQTASERAATRTFLEGSPEGRAWARTVSEELRPLAGDALPELPAEPAEPAPAARTRDEPAATRAARRERSRAAAVPAAGGASVRADGPARDPERSSRLGGILVLAFVAAILAAGLFLLLRGGDDDASQASTPTAAAAGATGASGATGAGGLPQQQINLTPPRGGDRDALGYAVLAEGGFAFQAEGLPRSDLYDVWLYNSRDEALPIGFAQYDAESKRLAGALPQLPAEAAQFSSLVVTKQTSREPRRPGRIVLRGAIKRAGS